MKNRSYYIYLLVMCSITLINILLLNEIIGLLKSKIILDKIISIIFIIFLPYLNFKLIKRIK